MSLQCYYRMSVTLLTLILVVPYAPSEAEAQLAPGTCLETVGWNRGPHSEWITGADPAEADPISAEDSGTGWNLSSHVSFPSNPPRMFAVSSVLHDETEYEGIDASVQVDLVFEFEIVEIENPGVPITTIPLRGMAWATDEAAQNGGFGLARATFDLVSTEHLGVAYAEAMTDQQPGQRKFDYFFGAQAIRGEIFRVTLSVQTQALSLVPIVGDYPQVTADQRMPAFWIQDTVIGGTNPVKKWSECCEIVYGGGAMTSVGTSDQTSWGRLKALY